MDICKYIAGGLSGVIEVILTHPLDYIKTKKQNYIQNGNKYYFYKELINEKKFHFYRGVKPRIIGVAPMRLLFWGVQDSIYEFCRQQNNNILFSSLSAGIIGGSCQTLIDNPIEIYKVKKMTNQKIIFKDILLKNYGFSSTLLRNCCFGSCLTLICFDKKDKDNLTLFAYSALGGMVGSIVTQPIDYVKTQQQINNDNRNTFSILRQTFKENPYKLYAGGFNRALLSFCSMGIGFVVYNRIYKEISCIDYI